jgi:hypothetical protein
MVEEQEARKDEVLHFLIAFVLRLALPVMCVDVCFTPQCRTHTRGKVLEVCVDRGKRDGR